MVLVSLLMVGLASVPSSAREEPVDPPYPFGKVLGATSGSTLPSSFTCVQGPCTTISGTVRDRTGAGVAGTWVALGPQLGSFEGGRIIAWHTIFTNGHPNFDDGSRWTGFNWDDAYTDTIPERAGLVLAQTDANGHYSATVSVGKIGETYNKFNCYPSIFNPPPGHWESLGPEACKFIGWIVEPLNHTGSDLQFQGFQCGYCDPTKVTPAGRAMNAAKTSAKYFPKYYERLDVENGPLTDIDFSVEVEVPVRVVAGTPTRNVANTVVEALPLTNFVPGTNPTARATTPPFDDGIATLVLPSAPQHDFRIRPVPGDIPASAWTPEYVDVDTRFPSSAAFRFNGNTVHVSLWSDNCSSGGVPETLVRFEGGSAMYSGTSNIFGDVRRLLPGGTYTVRPVDPDPDDGKEFVPATRTITVGDTPVEVPTFVYGPNRAPNPPVAVVKEKKGSPLTATFDATGSTDPDVGDQLDYNWEVNDAVENEFAELSAFTGETAEHVFPKPGRHTWKLTVTDRRGCEASTEGSVELLEGALEGKLSIAKDGTATSTAALNEPVTVTAELTNIAGSELTGVYPALTAEPTSGLTIEDAPEPPQTLQAGETGTFTFKVTGTAAKKFTLTLKGTGKLSSGATVTADPTTKDLSIGDPEIVVNDNGDASLSTEAKDADVCDTQDPMDVEAPKCTLRAAIELVNGRDGAKEQTITFNIDAAPRIYPESPLPTLNKKVSIDGTSQPEGWVEIWGGRTGGGDGLTLNADSTVRGMVINGFGEGAGIHVIGGSSHKIVGNKIGTDDAGVSGVPNKIGIKADVDGVLIGGVKGSTRTACADDCNLISGNTDYGVFLQTGGTVQGNWIGPNADGLGSVLPITDKSIARDPDDPSTSMVVVGGNATSPGVAPGNVVGGRNGIYGQNFSAIEGNLIGVSPDGQRALALNLQATVDGRVGINAMGMNTGTVGLIARNVISGYSVSGGPQLIDEFLKRESTYWPGEGGGRIAFDAPNPGVGAITTRDHAMLGNLIGTNGEGTAAIPNDVGMSGAIYNGENVVSGNDIGVLIPVSGETPGFGHADLDRDCLPAHGPSLIGLTKDGNDAIRNRFGVVFHENLQLESICTQLVISGNGIGVYGIDVDRFVSRKNDDRVFIGTDVLGTSAVPNDVGIELRGSPSNQDENAVDRKVWQLGGLVVAGNRGDGIRLMFANNPPPSLADGLSHRSVPIDDSLFGVGVDGGVLPNGGAGISVSSVDESVSVVIDGTKPGGVVIAHNEGPGVRVRSDSAGGGAKVTVRGASVFDNGGGGIDTRLPLRGPVLDSLSVTSGELVVRGSTRVTTDPSLARDVVELFVSRSCRDVSGGLGQGELSVRRTTADALTGDFSDSFGLNLIRGMKFVTATWTDSDGRTSPFSVCVPIPVNTETPVEHPAGTMELEIRSNAGFAPGDYVVVNSTPPTVRKVDRLGSLIFEAPLPRVVPAGAVVVVVDPPQNDRLAPVIAVSSPAAGVKLPLGTTVPFVASCSDPGVGVERCDVPSTLDVSTLGTHTVTLRAWDTNGNYVSQVFTYEVTATVVEPTKPDLTIVKSHTGSFAQGSSGNTYSVVVTNSGAGAKSAGQSVSVTDTAPTGLTVTAMSGTGWTCTTLPTCTRSDVLAGGAPYPAITVTVDVAANASSPKVNQASVSTAQTESNSGNNTSSDSTVITAVAALVPDLAIAKTSSSTFVQGGSATYALTVTNTGTGPSVGSIRVVDTLPVGLETSSRVAADWDCSASTAGVLDCARATPLAAGASSVITLNVSIAPNAPASVMNTATVSGGGETNTSDNQGSVTKSVTSVVSSGTIIIRKVTSPAGGTGFGFTSDVPGAAGFSLDDGQNRTITAVLPGSYSVTEQTKVGSTLTNLVCSDPTSNSTVNVSTRTASINLVAGETVDCTFTNTQTPAPSAEQLYAPSVTPPDTIAIGSQYAVETAQRVNVTCAGTVTGVWWYRTASDTGTNTVTVWRGGTVVGSGVGNPGATGWVRLGLTSPLLVSPGDQLLVGVHHPNGAYGYRLNGFTNRSVNSASGCLVAPASAAGAQRMVCTSIRRRRWCRICRMRIRSTSSARTSRRVLRLHRLRRARSSSGSRRRLRVVPASGSRRTFRGRLRSR